MGYVPVSSAPSSTSTSLPLATVVLLLLASDDNGDNEGTQEECPRYGEYTFPFNSLLSRIRSLYEAGCMTGDGDDPWPLLLTDG